MILYDFNLLTKTKKFFCGGRETRTPTGLPPAVFKTAAIPLCEPTFAFLELQIYNFLMKNKIFLDFSIIFNYEV